MVVLMGMVKLWGDLERSGVQWMCLGVNSGEVILRKDNSKWFNLVNIALSTLILKRPIICLEILIYGTLLGYIKSGY